MSLNPIDAAIVVAYFLLVMGVGIYMERRAGKDIESYFLASGKMPWWLLGMSGSSGNFDITGTMWMVSTFYLLGMRGMWEHWMWGLPFGGFLMAYKAKWAYRSGVLTGVEWLVFRFGDGRGGQAARAMAVTVLLIVLVMMLGYAGTGVGKFVEEFLPVSKNMAVTVLFIFTGIYVMLGGFFGVVYSDFFQTVLLSLASIYIAVIAFVQLDPASLHQAVGSDWFSIRPVMNLPNQPAQYPDPFGLLVMMWVTRGVLVLLTACGGTDFQRFRAARSETDASKIGMLWALCHSLRWSMVIAFTVFGLSILSANGEVVDSEKVLPIVINRLLPIGIKGLVLAGLFAAFMSTFDSTLNLAASFVVNDIVKPLWKTATARDLVRVSYLSTAVIVVFGIIIGLHTDRIAVIWNPINFALGTALLAPSLLTPYWWRIGGAAYCASGVITLPIAVYIMLFTDMRELQYFPILAITSVVSCIVAALVFPPPPKKAMMNYYRKIRPFGFWGPVRDMLRAEGEDPSRFERDRYDVPVAIVGSLFFVLLYLCMMDVVLHNWGRLLWAITGTTACGVFLYVFWWKVLQRHDEHSDS